jgi:F-type H+-transporting ATPase subunit epsilon
MAEKFLLEIVAPSGVVLSKEVEETTAPGVEGEFGVLRGHVEFLTALKPGPVSYRVEGALRRLAVGRGFAEVGPEKTSIMVESAEPAENINAEEVRAQLKKLEEALKGLKEEDPDYRRLAEEMELVAAKAEACGRAKPP